MNKIISIDTGDGTFEDSVLDMLNKLQDGTLGTAQVVYCFSEDAGVGWNTHRYVDKETGSRFGLLGHVIYAAYRILLDIDESAKLKD